MADETTGTETTTETTTEGLSNVDASNPNGESVSNARVEDNAATMSEGGDTSTVLGGEGETTATEVIVPEAYELTAPEGVTLDPESIELATPIFKEMGLSNEAANKLMPVAADFANRAAAAAIAKHTLEQAGAFQSQTREWLENAKGDAEIGGQNWDKSIAASAKALDLLGLTKGTPFRTLLNETGLGNHPEMIRAFARIGERVSEDGFALAGATSSSEKSIDSRWYEKKGD